MSPPTNDVALCLDREQCVTHVSSPFRPADPLMGLAACFGLATNGRLRITRVIVVAVCCAWAPVLLLAVIDGTAWGPPHTIPLLSDFVPYGRCLGALPLLILFIHIVPRRTALAFEHLKDAGVIDPVDIGRFDETLARARRLLAAPVVLSLTWIVTAALTMTAPFVNRELNLESWMWNRRGELSGAGMWYLFVSAPLIRYLLLRTLWTYVVWIWVLLNLARLRLHLNALHPDQCCGLSFLGDAQLAFVPALAALGVQLGCGVADAVFHTGAALASFKWLGVAFLSLALLGFVLPLVAFSAKMWLAREEAEFGFDRWAAGAARYLEEQMLDRRKDPHASSSMQQISTMTDAASLYDRMLRIKLAPLDRMHVTVVVLAAAVSLLTPLIAFLPLHDVGEHLVEMLL